MGLELSFKFFVAAYLLRQVLHEFGFGKQYADERELSYQAVVIPIVSKQANLCRQ